MHFAVLAAKERVYPALDRLKLRKINRFYLERTLTFNGCIGAGFLSKLDTSKSQNIVEKLTFQHAGVGLDSQRVESSPKSAGIASEFWSASFAVLPVGLHGEGVVELALKMKKVGGYHEVKIQVSTYKYTTNKN